MVGFEILRFAQIDNSYDTYLPNNYQDLQERYLRQNSVKFRQYQDIFPGFHHFSFNISRKTLKQDT